MEILESNKFLKNVHCKVGKIVIMLLPPLTKSIWCIFVFLFFSYTCTCPCKLSRFLKLLRLLSIIVYRDALHVFGCFVGGHMHDAASVYVYAFMLIYENIPEKCVCVCVPGKCYGHNFNCVKSG